MAQMAGREARWSYRRDVKNDVGIPPSLVCYESAGDFALYSAFRITVALAGHAAVNSIDSWMLEGTSARVIRSKPNLGKYASAVVVSR